MSSDACKKSNAGGEKSSPPESLRDYRERMFGEYGRCKFDDQGKCVRGKRFYRKRAKAALSRAHDIRKFEIELLWKRTTYMATFQTLLFAALGVSFSAAVNASKADVFRIIVCIVGISSSSFWYFMNVGSRFWCKNWEKHVDFMENEFEGKLYKTILNENGKQPYSVSRVNIAISIMFLITWLVLAAFLLFDFVEWLDNVIPLSYEMKTAGIVLLLIAIPFLLRYCGLMTRFKNVVTNERKTSGDVFFVERALPTKLKDLPLKGFIRKKFDKICKYCKSNCRQNADG